MDIDVFFVQLKEFFGVHNLMKVLLLLNSAYRSTSTKEHNREAAHNPANQLADNLKQNESV